MVMTILEARVEEAQWPALKAAYQAAINGELEPGLVRTDLIQSKQEPALWRIQTVWRSQAALDAMRATGETPRGVLIFQAAEALAALSVFEVVLQAKAA